MTEIHQIPVTVLVSPQLLQQLGEWSPPVHIKVIQKPDGGYEMIAKEATVITHYNMTKERTL